MFDKDKLGFECEEQADGTKICKRFKAKKGEVYATGTNFELIADPNTCSILEKGRVMEEDRDAVDKMKEDMQNKCKRGF